MKDHPQENKKRRTVERMCVICRERFPQKSLLRLTERKDGSWALDLSRKAQARGLYLCTSESCLKRVLSGKKLPFQLAEDSRELLSAMQSAREAQAEKAADKGAAKSAEPDNEKRKAALAVLSKAEEDAKLILLQPSTAGNEEKILSLLGLAERAGGLVSGMDAVLALKASGKNCLLCAAADISPGSLKRLHRGDDVFPLIYLRKTDKNELGRRIGRRGTALCAVVEEQLGKEIRLKALRIHEPCEDKSQKMNELRELSGGQVK